MIYFKPVNVPYLLKINVRGDLTININMSMLSVQSINNNTAINYLFINNNNNNFILSLSIIIIIY